jgi:hypothetical protein
VTGAQDLLLRALAREAEAQRLLLDGEAERALPALAEVADLYRRSWEAAPPRSFGRLVGYLKAAVLTGDADEAAAYVRSALGDEGDSPASAYAVALAGLVQGDDGLAARAARTMREGGEAFERTADALAALAECDPSRYEAALGAILRDFEARKEHLTGVPIADTALVLERLAEERGMAVRPRSPALPWT